MARKKNGEQKLTKKAIKKLKIKAKFEADLDWAKKNLSVGQWIEYGEDVGQISSIEPRYNSEGDFEWLNIWFRVYGSDQWIGVNGQIMTEGFLLPVTAFNIVKIIEKPTYEPEIKNLSGQTIDFSQYQELLEKVKQQKLLLADKEDLTLGLGNESTEDREEFVYDD